MGCTISHQQWSPFSPRTLPRTVAATDQTRRAQKASAEPLRTGDAGSPQNSTSDQRKSWRRGWKRMVTWGSSVTRRETTIATILEGGDRVRQASPDGSSSGDTSRADEGVNETGEGGDSVVSEFGSIWGCASGCAAILSHHLPNYLRDQEIDNTPLHIPQRPGLDTLSASPMPSLPVTVPCQYRTGKTLGSGTYAIVKEAIHIDSGKYYACKVINKKLMEGREYMVRNEIAVLKKISKGHSNIVTLHDYFETSHNLYLCFDLCTGGELFDRICAKGNYYEADAAELVRTIFKAVQYIHDADVVHRDLKPENLLFRTPAEEADIMIADFGLSRVMDSDKLKTLTEICGTPGYMAPEIFKKTGHGKPVDVWAMGVITYFLLAGYTPFDRETQQKEMDAIIAGDYKFEPEEYWANVSDTARNFVSYCLTVDSQKRPTAGQALQHKWLSDVEPHFVADPESPTGGPKDLLPHVRSHFNARKTFRKAVYGMMAVKRMTSLSHHLDPEAENLKGNVQRYKEESEKEVMEDTSVVHHHNFQHPSEASDAGSPLKEGHVSPPPTESDLHTKMANASLGAASKNKAPA